MKKSMGEVLSHLLNFRHLDLSCYLDKVNGAAADAPAPMVFATLLRKLYRDKTLSAHLEGKAKTIYAATQAATNYTAGRYKKYAAGMSIFGFAHCK